MLRAMPGPRPNPWTPNHVAMRAPQAAPMGQSEPSGQTPGWMNAGIKNYNPPTQATPNPQPGLGPSPSASTPQMSPFGPTPMSTGSGYAPRPMQQNGTQAINPHTWYQQHLNPGMTNYGNRPPQGFQPQAQSQGLFGQFFPR